MAKRCPNDATAKLKFTECNKIVKKQAFERAIANDAPEKKLAEKYSAIFASVGKYGITILIILLTLTKPTYAYLINHYESSINILYARMSCLYISCSFLRTSKIQ